MKNLTIKRIQFIGFWNGYTIKGNNFTSLLEKYGYKFEVVDTNPDIIIFSVFGPYYNEKQYLKTDKNIKKIFYTGENKPVIKEVDLNLTFNNTYKHNNIRFPLWLLYGYNTKMQLTKKKAEGFCCFIYTSNVKHRNEFFKELSKYKIVDSGGGCLNNIGGRVKDKIEFQKKYKFCIAYENSLTPGYTTEKILDSYKSNCIPIYYGSETIKDDFNPETFINAHDFKNNNDLIDYIKKVDTDESLYNSYMNKCIFSKKWLDILDDPEEVYFKNIAQKIIT
tara:strand:+ start:18 stop:851 length:834 start_codon:yes stop_codon:yes gene_type:complete